MFSKHVWYDRQHQAEVFMTDAGVISGTIVAYKGAVSVINPRPEILIALYQEAKIKRILSLKAVLLTDNTIEFTRGLCALVNYSRGLRRRSPLVVVTRDDSRISTDFLNSCCSRLLEDSAFDLEIVPLSAGESREIGKGSVRFRRSAGREGVALPYLEVATEHRRLHYFDESHHGPLDGHAEEDGKPNVIIRAAALLNRVGSTPGRLIEPV
jgi:hypothetical protein